MCDKDGVKSNPLLCCSFCPRALHYQCAGMELRQRAPAGLWQCPACRRAEDGARVLDAVPPRRQRPERLRANAHNTTLVPGEQPPQLLLAAPAALPVVSAASAVLPATAASVQLEARPVVIPLPSSRVPTVAARPAAADVTRPALKRPATVVAAEEGPRTRRRIEKTGEPLASGVNVVATEWEDFLPPANGPQPRSGGVKWIDRVYGTFRAVEMLQPMSPGGPTRSPQGAASVTLPSPDASETVAAEQRPRVCRQITCRLSFCGHRRDRCPHCGHKQ